MSEQPADTLPPTIPFAANDPLAQQSPTLQTAGTRPALKRTGKREVETRNTSLEVGAAAEAVVSQIQRTSV